MAVVKPKTASLRTHSNYTTLAQAMSGKYKPLEDEYKNKQVKQSTGHRKCLANYIKQRHWTCMQIAQDRYGVPMSMSDSGDSLIAELITKDVQAEFDCTVRAPYEYPDSDSDDDAPDTTKLKMPKMHVYKVCVNDPAPLLNLSVINCYRLSFAK